MACLKWWGGLCGWFDFIDYIGVLSLVGLSCSVGVWVGSVGTRSVLDGCVAVNNKEKKAWCQNSLNK